MPKKKRAAPQPAIAESIFDHFEGRGFGSEPTGQDKPEKVDSASLMERIAKLETERDELRRAQYMAPAAAPQAPQHHIDPAKLTLDLKDLPDAVDKPADFQAELARRINAVVETRVHAVKQEVSEGQDQAAAADRLWSGFSTAHPEWADYPQLVGVVAKQVVEDATSRGIDPQKYVLGNPELYFEDVNKALRAKYGALAKGEEDVDEEGEAPGLTPSQREAPDADEDAGRTGGIFGGAESGGRPSQGGTARPGDMMKDLMAVQARMGLV